MHAAPPPPCTRFHLVEVSETVLPIFCMISKRKERVLEVETKYIEALRGLQRALMTICIWNDWKDFCVSLTLRIASI